MQNNIPAPPKYDGKESTLDFERKVGEYVAKINKLKYDIILEFLNIYMSKNNITYDKLKNFKNIEESVFMDSKHNKVMYDTYSEQLGKNLNIGKTDIIYEGGDINFIAYIQKLLSKISYLMVKKKNGKYVIFCPNN